MTTPQYTPFPGEPRRRFSFPELMHGLFWLALIVFLILFAMRAFTMMDLLEKRMQQGTLHHEKLIALADKSLKDHETFLAEHQRMLERLQR